MQLQSIIILQMGRGLCLKIVKNALHVHFILAFFYSFPSGRLAKSWLNIAYPADSSII